MKKKDWTNVRFGRLVALHPAENIGGSSAWFCECDCGNTLTTYTNNLVRGLTKSCGCLKREAASSKGEDLAGQVFGRLTVLRLYSKSPRRWECSCECGSIKAVGAFHLKSGHTQSCGCLQREATIVSNQTHRMSKTPTYGTWCCLRNRCLKPTDPSYPRYGGRGITVCERWKVFENFLADMGEKPAGMTIERIDNDKGYEPENCRWADRTEQARNRRSNVILMVRGDEMLALDFIRRFGLDRKRTYWRLKRGDTPDQILENP